MTEQEILAKANIFIESQGFHLMTREDIPRFLECATEAYGGISYPLDDYFMGHVLDCGKLDKEALKTTGRAMRS